MDADGAVSTATGTKIVNNSAGPVKVSNVEIEASNNWELVDYNSDFITEKVGTKKLGLQINGDTTSQNGSLGFSSDNWPTIKGLSELDINYNAAMAPQKESISEEVSTVTFTIGWIYDDEILNPPSLDSTSLSISKGETQQLTVNNSYGKNIAYESSNTSVATIDSSGLITALDWGTSIITITVGATTKLTCTVEVPKVLSGISLSSNSLNLQIGDTHQLTASTSYRSTISWSSSNQSVASVSETGLVTANSDGTAVIQATLGNITASCNVTVKTTYTDFEITADNRSMVGYTGAGNLVIPSTFRGDDGTNYRVTSIGDWAFDNCSLAQVTIPDSVTSIGKYAFMDCSSLVQVTIPDSVKTIGEAAFLNCTKLESIILPSGLTTIENQLLADCYGLKSVTIPDSVTTIGDYAFNDCGSLADVTIPTSVTTIKSNAFYMCTSLGLFKIPDSVTEIGNKAFFFVPGIEYHGTATGKPWGARTMKQ